MRRVYQVFGTLLFVLYAALELSGWELAGNAAKGAIPPGARNAGGYRTYHFWSGGK
jgi:hypothetical protein